MHPALPPAPGRPRPLSGGRVQAFFEGAAFPLAVLSLLAALCAGTLALVVMPAGEAGLAAFAAEFRRWCLGGDASGGLDAGWLLATVGGPVMVSVATVLIWWRPLAAVEWRRPSRWLLPVAGGVAAAALAFAGLVPAARVADATDLEFPAPRLRTRLPAPELALVGHDGQPVTLPRLRGRVVLLTSVYARCSTACPMILAQARRAVDGLTDEERADLTVVAVTLDPEHDTPARLAELATARGIAAPAWRLATGEPAVVEATLDRMGVARERDAETGVIDHASLFLLIDREGRLAYRFTVGELQERWMAEALRLLVAEPPPAPLGPAGPPA